MQKWQWSAALPTAGLWSATFQKRTSPRTPEVACGDSMGEGTTDDQQNQLRALLFFTSKKSGFRIWCKWWCFMLLVSNISTRIPRFSVGFGGLVWIHGQLSHDQQLMCYIFTPFFSRYCSKGINHAACSWLPRKDLNPYSKQLWLKAMIFSMISRC